MTKKQEELKKQYGTPEEFEMAVWNAYADLMITKSEALSAIREYKLVWDDSHL